MTKYLFLFRDIHTGISYVYIFQDTFPRLHFVGLCTRYQVPCNLIPLFRLEDTFTATNAHKQATTAPWGDDAGFFVRSISTKAPIVPGATWYS